MFLKGKPHDAVTYEQAADQAAYDEGYHTARNRVLDLIAGYRAGWEGTGGP